MRRVGLLLVLAGMFLSCGDFKLPARGADDEILVFADDATWDAMEHVLRQVFEDTVWTPQPERWHVLRRVPFDRWDHHGREKNRIIVGPLEGTGPVSSYLSRSLDPAVQQLVRDGREFIFNKYDSRARGQILMFLTAQNLKTLQGAIESKATELSYYFSRMSVHRELAAVAAEGSYHKKDIERSLAANYGWTMTIQHDYHVAIDSASGRFFWIRRASPSDMERWIFVHWKDVDDPGILTDRYVLSLRDSLTRMFLRTVGDDAYVEIAPYHLEIERVNFLKRFAYEVRGNWRFSDKSGGGPFVNYTLYDEPTRRLYMLDGSIFAPRVEKKKLIIQVDALLHTFRTVAQLSDAERKEL
ncbi:MAG: DUF4837 family protein [Ignavibacteriales bacterium]|nr:DUF4837 family protein [Ignavibacteriales bacterium]